ncbi:MAG TPA: chemotaxis protein CheW [Acidothermaceae bacterium]|jgi:chemotaxis signal transduction protein
MIGFITFRLGDRNLACRLDEVREVVRLDGLDVLPGMTPPISGLLELRGNPLPVVDLRGTSLPGSRGDVLVMAAGIDAIGAIVDQVIAVHDEDELVSLGERPSGLPDYVIDVLRHDGISTGRGGPVLLVHLQALLSVAV